LLVLSLPPQNVVIGKFGSSLLWWVITSAALLVSVCVPFAARRSVEDSSVGPGRLRTVVQAAGTWVFKLPRVEQGARSVELRASELAMILDGIDVSRLKRVRRYERAV
jgi:hypothetical protein